MAADPSMFSSSKLDDPAASSAPAGQDTVDGAVSPEPVPDSAGGSSSVPDAQDTATYLTRRPLATCRVSGCNQTVPMPGGGVHCQSHQGCCIKEGCALPKTEGSSFCEPHFGPPWTCRKTGCDEKVKRRRQHYCASHQNVCRGKNCERVLPPGTRKCQNCLTTVRYAAARAAIDFAYDAGFQEVESANGKRRLEVLNEQEDCDKTAATREESDTPQMHPSDWRDFVLAKRPRVHENLKQADKAGSVDRAETSRAETVSKGALKPLGLPDTLETVEHRRQKIKYNAGLCIIPSCGDPHGPDISFCVPHFKGAQDEIREQSGRSNGGEAPTRPSVHSEVEARRQDSIDLTMDDDSGAVTRGRMSLKFIIDS
ncbi:hypothetical protein JX266_009135 [Neoarthrinium moseri]|nr:hypothetical protein JX266_009135 [Neoarthrinium moseri]